MYAIISYPNIDPILFSIGNFEIRWYGLMYIISFLVGYIFIKKNLRAKRAKINDEQYDALMFNILLGVVIGARLGYVIFYNLSAYLANPLRIFAVWEGGMSFHGGWIAVIILGFLFVKKNKLNFYRLADAVVPFAALGLGLGRIGNFINAELYGRVTDVPWGMVFPGSDGLPRHPSQLYQAFTEGFMLFIILQYLQRRITKDGLTFWLFVGLYGVFRFIVEFYREPDHHLGFVLLHFTMGQILSIGMIIVSFIGLMLLEKKYANS